MKQEDIDKRIKELQKDSKYTFKLTEDVIDIVYRTAIEDIKKENEPKSKSSDDIIFGSSKDLNNKFGNKKKTKFGSKEKEEKSSIDDFVVKDKTKDIDPGILFNIKRDVYFEIMKYIEHHDLMDVYIYVKEKAKAQNIYEIGKHWPAP